MFFIYVHTHIFCKDTKKNIKANGVALRIINDEGTLGALVYDVCR